MEIRNRLFGYSTPPPRARVALLVPVTCKGLARTNAGVHDLPLLNRLVPSLCRTLSARQTRG
jgi:hypothetical protein